MTTAMINSFTAAIVGLQCLSYVWFIRAASPRHIVHIVADDLGYNDLGIMNGNLSYTPSIDSLIEVDSFFPNIQ